MSENNGMSDIRKTNYAYDDLHRLASVGFDNDGNGTVDETVSYEYDNGGVCTKLTMPVSLLDFGNKCPQMLAVISAFSDSELSHLRSVQHGCSYTMSV